MGTRLESVKVLGLVDIQVIAARFHLPRLGGTNRFNTKNPQSILISGVPVQDSNRRRSGLITR